MLVWEAGSRVTLGSSQGAASHAGDVAHSRCVPLQIMTVRVYTELAQNHMRDYLKAHMQVNLNRPPMWESSVFGIPVHAPVRVSQSNSSHLNQTTDFVYASMNV